MSWWSDKKKYRLVEDICRKCGHKRVIVLHKGQSEHHKKKCIVCKSCCVWRKKYIAPAGAIAVDDE